MSESCCCFSSCWCRSSCSSSCLSKSRYWSIVVLNEVVHVILLDTLVEVKVAVLFPVELLSEVVLIR
eukprot:581160-Pyramimonas_sp.AAC.1